MIKRETVVSLLAGLLVGALGIAPVVAGDGLGNFGPAQGGGGGVTDAELVAIGALTPTDGNVIVGDGSTWVAESGATARASLGALGGSLGATDNAILTADGTGGVTAQGSDATLSDAEVLDLTATGTLALGTTSSDVFLRKSTLVGTSVEARIGNNSGYGNLTGQVLASMTQAGNGLDDLAWISYPSGLRVGHAANVKSGWTADSTGSGSSAVSALDTALSRDSAGRVLVENGSGTVADLRAAGFVVGTADTSGGRWDMEAGVLCAREGDDSGNCNVRANAFWGSGGGSPSALIFSSATANTGMWFSNSDTALRLVANQRSAWASHQVTLTDNTATTIATIALASGARCGGTVRWSVDVTDGTDHQVVTGSFTFSAVDKAGALTTDVDADATVSTAASAGTCTVTPTILDGSDAISLQITADTSLTPTAMLIRFNMDLSGTSAATVTLP